MVEQAELERLIRQNIEGVSHVEIEDLTGTKDHYKALVVASSFAGLTKIQQHQSVYRSLGDLMLGPVHALSLATYTPENFQAKLANELTSLSKKK